MIRSPLALKLDPNRPFKDQVYAAAQWGLRGVVFDAAGDLGPDRLSETGRREVRHLFRSTQLHLVAVSLPTRRPFDTLDQLDDRLARADRAFALAYELGTNLVLARVGGVPPETEAPRREAFVHALRELGRRADHRGVRLAVESGPDAGAVLAGLLDQLASTGLAASLDPAALLAAGVDPVRSIVELHANLAHAYAADAAGVTRIANPRGFGFAPGVLDWEEYLGALEEVGYRGFLTLRPDPVADPSPQVRATLERLKRF